MTFVDVSPVSRVRAYFLMPSRVEDARGRGGRSNGRVCGGIDLVAGLCLCFFLCLERAHSLPSPLSLEGCSVFPLWPTYLELFGGIEQQAKQSSAIVLQHLDEPCLVQEATELDELPGSCASFLHPIAGVGAVLCEHEPISQHGQTVELSR